MANPLSVLIVSSQAAYRDAVAEVVRKCGLRPVFSPTLADAQSILEQKRPAIIFCGDDLPDSGLCNSLQTFKAAGVPIIALSHLAEWVQCVDAISAGAFDYIACPPDVRETERVLRLAVEFSQGLYARHSAA